MAGVGGQKQLNLHRHQHQLNHEPLWQVLELVEEHLEEVMATMMMTAMIGDAAVAMADLQGHLEDHHRDLQDLQAHLREMEETDMAMATLAI